MSETFRYFGYGSLINDKTRPPNISAEKAVLHGWRREWRVTGQLKTSWGAKHNVCALSVRRDASCSIAGILVEEPMDNLANLDRREARYDRFPVDVNQGVVTQKAFVYQASSAHAQWGSDEAPICLSYIDCVLQGVLHHFGEEGLANFFQTTDGWHVPILNDRDQPIYPRAIELNHVEVELIDAKLKAYDVCWK